MIAEERMCSAKSSSKNMQKQGIRLCILHFQARTAYLIFFPLTHQKWLFIHKLCKNTCIALSKYNITTFCTLPVPAETIELCEKLLTRILLWNKNPLAFILLRSSESAFFRLLFCVWASYGNICIFLRKVFLKMHWKVMIESSQQEARYETRTHKW